MVTNYFAANVKPKRKRGELLYGTVVCKNMKESEKLFQLIDAISEWNRIEAVARNGRKVTVTFFAKEKNKKNVNSKKKMRKLQ